MIDEGLVTLLDSEAYQSGQHIAEKLNVSRAAVWKKIQQLQDLGIPVESLKGRGYRLSQGLSVASEAQVVRLLKSVSSQNVGYTHKLITRSTNEDAMGLIKASQGPVAVGAEMQSAGRGRRGKEWLSPFGSSLYFSFALHWRATGNQLEGLSLAVGVEVCEVLLAMGVQGAQIKWPNDIYVAGEKLGGILIELAGEAGGELQMVIGIGLNVSLPEQIKELVDQPVTDCAEHAIEKIDKNVLTAELIIRLNRLTSRYGDQGLLAYQQRWKDLDLCFSRDLKILLGDKVVTGRGDGIAANGALRVLTSEGLREFNGGEVSVRV